MFALDVFLVICCAAIVSLIGFLIAIERESRAARKRPHVVLVPSPTHRVIAAPAPVARKAVGVGASMGREVSYSTYQASEMRKRAS